MSETLYHPDYLVSDDGFDNLYPEAVKHLAKKHWTPVAVARQAAAFLAQDAGSRILDIGAGIGKFCLIGAAQHQDCHFSGIEQRQELVSLAEAAKRQTALENVSFLTGNFQQIDFRHFDHFYFFNSFYENLADKKLWIDSKVNHSLSLYEHYTFTLYKKLAEMPRGTRLVTYHSSREVIPPEYKLARNPHNTMLWCWVRS